jgi:hypothetical protein
MPIFYFVVNFEILRRLFKPNSIMFDYESKRAESKDNKKFQK